MKKNILITNLAKTITSITFLLLLSSSANAQKRSKAIKLINSCYWEDNKRDVSDSLKNVTAIVTEIAGNIYLTINGNKYAACNLPANLKAKKLVISGIVFAPLPTERLAAMPLKITSAKIGK
jgi:hypothetical protein